VYFSFVAVAATYGYKPS